MKRYHVREAIAKQKKDDIMIDPRGRRRRGITYLVMRAPRLPKSTDAIADVPGNIVAFHPELKTSITVPPIKTK